LEIYLIDIMPIEVREIVIKTEISTTGHSHQAGIREKDLNTLKKQLFEECKKIISGNTVRTSYKR